MPVLPRNDHPLPWPQGRIMLIVADANIPFAAEAFAQYGEVRLSPGRELSARDLVAADALIVRSVTNVNEALLKGTAVRFVGTATIGIDHLDLPFLSGAGIPWASAAGCNARSVVEWVVAALAEICVARGDDWTGRTLGIVGHGNVGSRLAPVARRLGMNVLVNDPPLARAGALAGFVPLGELLAESDFVTLHVPMIRDGEDCTRHLIGAGEFARMKPGAVLLNASRGAVVNNAEALAATPRVAMVLDVFEGEPRPNRDLVAACAIATPHIAGYSFEGKVNGTRMMAEALGRFLGRKSAWNPVLPAPTDATITPTARGTMAAVRDAIRASYDIRADDARLREGSPLQDDAWGKHFDLLRKNYLQRREFANYTISDDFDNPAARQVLIGALGFNG
ncbi:4-phosphoerythronate dehydrogenase [Candidatus Sumerlaeota bacterium]|nr:4-phosphoerythronate dehydrogenase [Candidatus Sumerlaeota bacterium]